MKEIIITYFLNYILIIFLGFFYTFFDIGDLDSFVNGPSIYIVNIFLIITTLYLYLKSRRYEKKMQLKDILPLIALGVSIALFLNMLILLFSNNYSSDIFPFYLMLISSGIVGPIYEEILFRYIFYNRLTKKFSFLYAILINSFIFALVHFSFIKSIYAFVLGIIFCLVYHKKKNILAPILVHMAANTIVLFINGFSIPILFLSIINSFIFFYIVLS